MGGSFPFEAASDGSPWSHDAPAGPPMTATPGRAFIPGHETTPVDLVEFRPAGGLGLHLSVEEEMNGDPGLIRDRGRDHGIDVVDGRRVRIEDAAGIRRRDLPCLPAPDCDSHVTRFQARHPARRVVAVQGYGNLLMNDHVVAVSSGLFFARGGEPFATRSYFSIGLREGDAKPCRFDGTVIATRPPEWDSIVTGQPVIWESRPVDPRSLGPDAFADLRHLLLPGYVEVAGQSLDFGFEQLRSDPALLAAAIAGRPVTLRLAAGIVEERDADAPVRSVAVPAATLSAALKRKGYIEVPATTSARGEFRILGDRVEIAFREGIYPHSVLAVAADGRPRSFFVTGLSNRAGITVRDLGTLLAEQERLLAAILLDNGGDVGLALRRGPGFRQVIRPSEPDRRASWRMRAALLHHAGSGETPRRAGSVTRRRL